MKEKKLIIFKSQPIPDQGKKAELVVKRIACLLYGLFSLVAPAIVLLSLLVFSPALMEKWVAAYTGTSFSKFQATPGLPSDLISFAEACSWWKIYVQRLAIETFARSYNALRPALALTTITIAISLLVRWFVPRYWQRLSVPTVVESGAFFSLFLVAALFGDCPKPLTFGAAMTGFYVTNFPLGTRLTGLVYQRGKGFCLAMLPLSLVGAAHLLFPSALFTLMLRGVRMEPHRAQRLAILLGRACVCGISVPLVSLFAYSLREIPLSHQARLLLPVPDLYDIVIDHAVNRLLVTKKEGGTGWALRLDEPTVLGNFTIPTAELEDIELDPGRREIYHVDRATGNILVIDADTFRVLRVGKTPVISSGSTKIALDKSSNQLLISWENDNLFVADRNSLHCELLGTPGNMNPLADGVHGVVYLNSEFGSYLQTLDLKPGRVLCQVKSPARGERMVLARTRGELYVPDAQGGQVWVYSTPELNLLCKIPAQFGVRPLAFDDEHGLLLNASVVTGYLDVTDPVTGKRLQHHYVGKYGRIIQVDSSRRHAFITLTKDGLCMLNY